MSKNINLKDAEKHVFQLATFQDGVWEIYLGLFFTLMSLFSITRTLFGPTLNGIFIILAALLMVGIVWVVKRRITLPRIGLVKLGEGTKRKVRNTNLVTWALVVITFGFLLLNVKNLISEPTWNQLPKWVTDFDVDLVFALVIVAFFSRVAYVVGLPRFYLYGILLGIGNFTSTVLLVYNGVKFQWPLAIAGMSIILIGGIVFVQFLREYPLKAAEIIHVK